MISIKVKTLTNKLYNIKIEIPNIIQKIKHKISEIHDQKLDAYNYKIIHLGRVLEDDEILDNTYDNSLFIVMIVKKDNDATSDISPLKNPIRFATTEKVIYPAKKEIIEESSDDSEEEPEVKVPIAKPIVKQAVPMSDSDEEDDMPPLIPMPEPVPAIPSHIKFDSDDEVVLNEEAMNAIESEEEDSEDDDIHDEETDDEEEPLVNNAHLNAEMDGGNFSQSDIDNINEIVNMGFDYYEVLQMYSACGNNKATTIELLFG